MAINIKATNTVLSDSIKKYAQKKLATFQKYVRPADTIHIELESDRHRSGQKFRAEITITAKESHSAEIYADARGNDLFEAIDLCLPKIKEQLLKNKDRMVSERRRQGAKQKNK